VLELEGQIKMEEMFFSLFLKMGKDSAARIELGRSPGGNSSCKSQ